jgi:3',5'-nucleoside bisphosphate phosphatase
MEFRADLHCHSTCSDGSFTPQELMAHAIKLGLKGLSITDHDTTQAYEILSPLAQQLEIKLVSGVEFSSHIKGASVHILGYAFNPFHPQILALCQRHQQRRKDRNLEILKRLKALNLNLSMEEILENERNQPHSIGRPHVAKGLVKKGYVSSIQEAFKKYLGEGKAAYAPGAVVSVEETLQVIHDAGGIAIIAHPHLIEQPSLVQDLLQMNFDGIECYYGNFNADQNKPWVKIADKKGWLKTGGSDFHGTIKSFVTLGSAWVDYDTFEKLERRYAQNLK